VIRRRRRAQASRSAQAEEGEVRVSCFLPVVVPLYYVKSSDYLLPAAYFRRGLTIRVIDLRCLFPPSLAFSPRSIVPAKATYLSASGNRSSQQQPVRSNRNQSQSVQIRPLHATNSTRVEMVFALPAYVCRVPMPPPGSAFCCVHSHYNNYNNHDGSLLGSSPRVECSDFLPDHRAPSQRTNTFILD